MSDNAMSTNRGEALVPVARNTGCPVLHVTPESPTDWVNPAAPLPSTLTIVKYGTQYQRLSCRTDTFETQSEQRYHSGNETIETLS